MLPPHAGCTLDFIFCARRIVGALMAGAGTMGGTRGCTTIWRNRKHRIVVLPTSFGMPERWHGCRGELSRRHLPPAAHGIAERVKCTSCPHVMRGEQYRSITQHTTSKLTRNRQRLCSTAFRKPFREWAHASLWQPRTQQKNSPLIQNSLLFTLAVLPFVGRFLCSCDSARSRPQARKYTRTV